MSNLTLAVADYLADLKPASIPPEVFRNSLEMVLDSSGALLAAADPSVSTSTIMAGLAEQVGGPPQATLVGQGYKTDVLTAALYNGTLGYTCDVEPHHPEGVLHPMAVMVPASLAMAEYVNATGLDFLTAIIAGCEIEYRLSIALGPVEQYDLGFHPSAVCGALGAAAAAGILLKLNPDQMARTLGLAGLQASGLMAWEHDSTENSRPFQIGFAARNGLTAAMLASRGFGGPVDIFDQKHSMFTAFSRNPSPEKLTADLGTRYDGIMELAIKPYSCVSFLHPGLDVLLGIARENKLKLPDIEAVTMRFPASGVHCIDSNPLKSHCAQYVLPVALSPQGLRVRDLFVDRRESDRDVARLSKKIVVLADRELDREFPERYHTIIQVETTDGRRFEGEGYTARGYPESPMDRQDIVNKFKQLAGTIASPDRIKALELEVSGLQEAPSVTAYAMLIGGKPDSEETR